MKTLACLLTLAVAATTANAATFNGLGVYSENFDSIGASGTAPPADWTAGVVSGSRNTTGGGAITSQALVSDNGSNGQPNGTGGTIGRSYNYGTTSASDRAIGFISTTNGGSGFLGGDHVLQVAIVNNTGAPINQMTIGYTGEQWRYGQDIATSAQGPEKLRVYYSTSPNSGWVDITLDFIAPKQDLPGATPDFTPLDGNLAENRVVLSKMFNLPSPLANGSTFYLRWLDWNDDGTNDHGIAVDDFSVTVAMPEVPEPASLGMLAVGALALLRRRK